VGIVGFDDSPWAQPTDPALSTVHHSAKDIGAHAADLVLQQLRGKTPRADGIVLPAPIVWRASA
jgi:DNA-binding LacI/PurR family transcriptional regulator